MQEGIGVGALKHVEVLYEGDMYDLACLLLQVHDAKDRGTNCRSRHTVNGLAIAYSLLADVRRDRILGILKGHGLPLGATVEHDEDLSDAEGVCLGATLAFGSEKAFL